MEVENQSLPQGWKKNQKINTQNQGKRNQTVKLEVKEVQERKKGAQKLLPEGWKVLDMISMEEIIIEAWMVEITEGWMILGKVIAVEMLECLKVPEGWKVQEENQINPEKHMTTIEDETVPKGWKDNLPIGRKGVLQ